MLLLSLFTALLPATFAVKCYICSWSPKDAANRTVICKDDLFEANAVAIAECDNGCEIYTHWDSNDSLEHIRRNCLQPETELTSDCKTEENVMYTSKRCTCNSNLCNSSSLLSTNIFVLSCILVLLMLRHFYGV